MDMQQMFTGENKITDNEKNMRTPEEIKSMLKLIPNGVLISGDDLEEIYSQDD